MRSRDGDRVRKAKVPKHNRRRVEIKAVKDNPIPLGKGRKNKTKGLNPPLKCIAASCINSQEVGALFLFPLP
jgi:hypothetical protein